MHTQCNSTDLTFEGLGRREVIGKFDGGRMSSDGGSVLLRASNRVLDLTARLARCFSDYRDERRTEHSVQALVGQRVYGLALGYEDLNDHDRLRDDSVLALALEREDVRGEARVRERDRGHPLAGSSTLNRLELGEPELAAEHRYKKMVAHREALDALLVDLFIEAHREAPEEIVLDLDATDDPLHGHQEGLVSSTATTGATAIFRCTSRAGSTCCAAAFAPRTSMRRTARCRSCSASSRGCANAGRIRASWSAAILVFAARSSWHGVRTMGWTSCWAWRRTPGCSAWSSARCASPGAAVRPPVRRRVVFATFATARSRPGAGRAGWSARAEWLPGARGANPRFVVTSLSKERFATRALYEELYCARGEMENRIKEQQLDLFADRTSTATLRANQLRLYFSAFAGVLLLTIRRLGLAGTHFARAQCGTIRTRFLKLAAVVKVTARKIWVSFSSVYPSQESFARILARLDAAAR